MSKPALSAIDLMLRACQCAQLRHLTPSQMLLMLALGRAKGPLESIEWGRRCGLVTSSVIAASASLEQRHFIISKLALDATNGKQRLTAELSAAGARIIREIWEQARKELTGA